MRTIQERLLNYRGSPKGIKNSIRRNRLNDVSDFYNSKEPYCGRSYDLFGLGKGRFCYYIIAMTMKCSFTKLVTGTGGRLFYSVDMMGQPVMKNNSRRNAECKYDQHGCGYYFFYEQVFMQDLFFATMLQI